VHFSHQVEICAFNMQQSCAGRQYPAQNSTGVC
jgi:hypothetical protein